MTKILEQGEGNYFETKHGARALQELNSNIKAPPMFQKFKTKVKTFDSFLQEKHAEDYYGTDDDMSDAFEAWVCNLDVAEVCEFAEQYGKSLQV